MSKFQRTGLDPSLKCEDTNNFYRKLKAKVIGQDEALEKAANIIQTYKAGLNQKGKPLAVVMYLGPTGVGKTKSVESIAECLFGNEKAFFKIDCGEFQSASSVATFIGSPPGYLGFKQSEPYISQDKLDKYQTKELPINIMLIDEVEKANESILQLFLGVLDKATLKTNAGEEIDFSNTIIFMTSNLGAEGIIDADRQVLGFDSKNSKKESGQIRKIALHAMEKFFKPEFANRIDHITVFNSLTQDSIKEILKLELSAVRSRIFTSKSCTKFTFLCTNEVNQYLLEQGYNKKYGARELRRIINKYVTDPLASLMMSGQVQFGDVVILSMNNGCIAYEKVDSSDISYYSDREWIEFREQILNLETEVCKPVVEMEKYNDMLVIGASESL